MKIAKYKKRYNFVQIIDEQGIRRIYDEILVHMRKVGEKEPEIIFTLNFSDNSSYIKGKMDGLG